MKHLNKRGLYTEIGKLMEDMGITYADYPLNIVKFLSEYMHGIAIQNQEIRTSGLHGMAFPSASPALNSVIILDSNRTEIERNFDCAHEYIHIAMHRGNGKSFLCYENPTTQRDSYLQWQANEGAAELLVPFWILLPMIKAHRACLATWHDILELKTNMAHRFAVTPAVIEHRFESLKYEIAQHLDGVPLSGLEILSQKQQNRLGIDVQSLNDVENVLFMKEMDSSSFGWLI